MCQGPNLGSVQGLASDILPLQLYKYICLVRPGVPVWGSENQVTWMCIHGCMKKAVSVVQV